MHPSPPTKPDRTPIEHLAQPPTAPVHPPTPQRSEEWRAHRRPARRLPLPVTRPRAGRTPVPMHPSPPTKPDRTPIEHLAQPPTAPVHPPTPQRSEEWRARQRRARRPQKFPRARGAAPNRLLRRAPRPPRDSRRQVAIARPLLRRLCRRLPAGRSRGRLGRRRLARGRMVATSPRPPASSRRPRPSGAAIALRLPARPPEARPRAGRARGPMNPSLPTKLGRTPIEPPPINDLVQPPIKPPPVNDLVQPSTEPPPVNDLVQPSTEPPPVNDLVQPPTARQPASAPVHPATPQRSESWRAWRRPARRPQNLPQPDRSATRNPLPRRAPSPRRPRAPSWQVAMARDPLLRWMWRGQRRLTRGRMQPRPVRHLRSEAPNLSPTGRRDERWIASRPPRNRPVDSARPMATVRVSRSVRRLCLSPRHPVVP
jgi:hypothetical protein